MFSFLVKNYPVSIFAKRKKGKWRWVKSVSMREKESRWQYKFTSFYSAFIGKRTVLTAVLAA